MGINPQGLLGRDWDSEMVTIRNGARVRVTATNETKTDQSGNKSRIVLLVNGAPKADVTNDSARVTVSYDIKEDGEYELVAIGSNERADAYSVYISLEEIERKVFG